MPVTSAQTEQAFDAAGFVRNLTHRPGVYRMLNAAGEVIYVGKARDLKRRVGSYFSGKATDAKTMALIRALASVEVTVTRTEAEALLLEYNLIKEHKPRYNILLRDDKSYPYIRITTDQEYPRISFYRGARPRKGKVFGPYPSAAAVRSTVNLLQKLFLLRQCEDSMFRNRSRPCLQHQIHRCSAPCVGLISEDEYRRDVGDAMLFLEGKGEAVIANVADRMEKAAAAQRYEIAARYRDQLKQLQTTHAQQLVAKSGVDFDALALQREHSVACIAVLYFRGGRLLGSRNFFPARAENASDEEVLRAFLLQYYAERNVPPEILVDREIEDSEGLAELFGDKTGKKVSVRWRLRGDRSRWIEMAATNARQGAEQASLSKQTTQQQATALMKALELDKPPERIECFDISHTMGEATVASCVVFGPEGPMKSAYRRFNIKDIDAGDDYAAMRQALLRRYSKLDAAQLPDIVLIDGGKGQLREAAEVFAELGIEDVLLVGVAKGEDRKPGRESLFLAGSKLALKLDPASPALHLIQRVRDEAHRFALAGHRGQRQKKRQRSPLEEIRGLGPKRRQALLRHFGGLQGLARASVDEIMRVHGISRQLAESIYRRLNVDGS